MPGKSRVILLVEDNDDDAELAALAFRAAKSTSAIVRARDGQEALDYLLAPDSAELPAVVLLDLQLPRVGGLEVLRELRAHERTRRLPVVILSSSNEDSDRRCAYDRYANSYVCKPIDHDEFVHVARQLSEYWTEINVLPPSPLGEAC